MDDLLLKRADYILAESRATRTQIHERRLRARLEVAKVRAEILMVRAERARFHRLRPETADMAGGHPKVLRIHRATTIRLKDSVERPPANGAMGAVLPFLIGFN
jgi:hypothetical protein